jgi:hypothetical protein
MQWALNEASKASDVRYRSMRKLNAAITKTYAPCGVNSKNLHEPLDGNQYLWLHYRDVFATLQAMLKDPKFAGVQYTAFKMLRSADGDRIYGSFHGGQWYEFAHSLAQTKGTGREQVSVYPVLGSCDVTYGRKNMPMYPYIVTAGCVSDDVRSEPGSWFLLAMLPHYRNSPAELAGRACEGPKGYRRRRVELHCGITWQ